MSMCPAQSRTLHRTGKQQRRLRINTTATDHRELHYALPGFRTPFALATAVRLGRWDLIELLRRATAPEIPARRDDLSLSTATIPAVYLQHFGTASPCRSSTHLLMQVTSFYCLNPPLPSRHQRRITIGCSILSFPLSS